MDYAKVSEAMAEIRRSVRWIDYLAERLQTYGMVDEGNNLRERLELIDHYSGELLMEIDPVLAGHGLVIDDVIEISNATLKDEDLAMSFMSFVNKNYNRMNIEQRWEADNIRGLLEKVRCDDNGDALRDDRIATEGDMSSWELQAHVVNDEFFEFFNDLCCDDFYFGAHVGDGACFGFWKEEDADPVYRKYEHQK